MSDIIAVIFDFDDTLVPDSTTLFLKERGIDFKTFWDEKYDQILKDGYDSTLGYLKLLLNNVGPDKPLGLLTNKELNEFGKSLDNKFYPGLPKMFDELREDAKKFDKNITIEYYIVSGGLRAIIEGSEIVKKYFTCYYGCEFSEEGDPPRISGIKRAINFTEKTRYIYEINKGISYEKSRKNPFLVNQEVEHEDRRIPMENMIYVGDGLTDVPCWSIIKNSGGMSVGVVNPDDPSTVIKALSEFAIPKRVVSLSVPNYKSKRDLGLFIRGYVAILAQKIANQKRERSDF